MCLKAVLHISQGIVPEHGQNKQVESNIEREPRWNQYSLQLSHISLTVIHCGYSVANAYDLCVNICMFLPISLFYGS